MGLLHRPTLCTCFVLKGARRVEGGRRGRGGWGGGGGEEGGGEEGARRVGGEGGEEGGGVANRQAKKVSPAEQSMVYELLIP